MKSTNSLSPRRPLRLPSLALLLAGAGAASGAVFTAGWDNGFANGGLVPDGNLVGWSDVRTFTIPAGQTITDVNVEFTVTGSWNGDIYAYVSHTNSPSAVILVNRPGRTLVNSFGYGDDHLRITLDDTAPLVDIHSYQTSPGFAAAISNNSAWKPDARAVSPLVVNGTEARTATLSLLNGINATSGQWTLFVADLGSGTQPTVTHWGLAVTTIPEPGTAALLLAFGVAVVAATRRRT